MENNRKVLKIIPILLFLFFSLATTNAQDSNQHFITDDIDNFWTAYDKIITTKDSNQQYEYLNTLFIEKGTAGLKDIMQVRNYTARSYIDAINNYPLFWNSVRSNTLKAKATAKNIETEVNKIKAIYPSLKQANIYFTIGALLSNGTTHNGKVLIGSELAFADRSTNSSELPASLSHLRSFFDSEPINGLVFLNVHEYVHTQQKTTLANNLLAQTVLEGVAEFVTVTATGKQSTTPAILYGKKNADRVRELFAAHMYNPFTGFWLYSNIDNEFKVRDMGYYVGYAICEKYYQKANNKNEAIKAMIELDYNNETNLAKFVDESGYFITPVEKLKRQFENNRPTIINIAPFKNGDKSVDPNLAKITIGFYERMDTRFRNFEYGPLSEKNVLRIKNFVGFSEDGKSASFQVELKPGHRYQIIIGEMFRSANGISLAPYLIDINTAGK